MSSIRNRDVAVRLDADALRGSGNVSPAAVFDRDVAVTENGDALPAGDACISGPGNRAVVFYGHALRGNSRAVADVDALTARCRLTASARENSVVFEQQVAGTRHDDRIVARPATNVCVSPKVDIEY